LPTGALPDKGQEAIRCPVAFPCRSAVEQPPLTVPNRPSPKHCEELIVEPLEYIVDRLIRRTHQMRRDALPSPLKLSLMEEAQASRQERDDSRGLVHAGGKYRGGPRLVVVLQEPGHLVLVVEVGAQMVVHRLGMALTEAIVQPFIVGVIESLLL